MKADNTSVIDQFGWSLFPKPSERTDNFRFDFTRYTVSDTKPTSTGPSIEVCATRPEYIVDLTKLNPERLNDLFKM